MLEDLEIKERDAWKRNGRIDDERLIIVRYWLRWIRLISIT